MDAGPLICLDSIYNYQPRGQYTALRVLKCDHKWTPFPKRETWTPTVLVAPLVSVSHITKLLWCPLKLTLLDFGFAQIVTSKCCVVTVREGTPGKKRVRATTVKSLHVEVSWRLANTPWAQPGHVTDSPPRDYLCRLYTVSSQVLSVLQPEPDGLCLAWPHSSHTNGT